MDRGGNNVKGDGNNSVNRGGNTMYGGRIIANGDGNTTNRVKGYL